MGRVAAVAAMSAAFEPTAVADALVNILAGAGVAIVARANHRSDPRGAVTRRIVFALSVISALFFVRALDWLAGSMALGRLASALAGVTPLVGLLVVEGLLRRHASAPLKMAIVTGGALVALSALVDWPAGGVSGLELLVVVFGGYAALTWLLLARDKASLTRIENRSIRRLLGAVAFLLPLILTDFRSVFPFVPVRLGALGVLILLYVSFSATGLSAPGRARALGLLGFLAIASCFAFGFAAIQDTDYDALAKVTAVGFAGLVLAGLLSEELGARSERARPPSPLLRAMDRDGFEAAFRLDPILQDAKILDAAELADVDDPRLHALLARLPVLRRRDAPWGLDPRDGGVERALSLLMSHDASHLLRLRARPLRLVAFTVSAIASDPRTEAEIDLAQRLGETLNDQPGDAGCGEGA
jgi:hypothetical protein